MTNQAFPLLIFDWDGTLMDSAAKIVACFQAAARDNQLPEIPAKLIEFQIGLSLERAWRNILSSLEFVETENLIERLNERYRDYFLALDRTPMPLYEGVEEGLRLLDEAGYLLTIATGKARRGLVRALAETDVQQHFVYTRCADEAFSKPHPKMVFDILEFSGLEAEEVLMIGDTTYDMQMAANAGVEGLAVSYGVHTKAQLSPLATQGCVSSFAAVLDFLI